MIITSISKQEVRRKKGISVKERNKVAFCIQRNTEALRVTILGVQKQQVLRILSVCL